MCWKGLSKACVFPAGMLEEEVLGLVFYVVGWCVEQCPCQNLRNSFQNIPNHNNSCDSLGVLACCVQGSSPGAGNFSANDCSKQKLSCFGKDQPQMLQGDNVLFFKHDALCGKVSVPVLSCSSTCSPAFLCLGPASFCKRAKGHLFCP